MATQLVGLKTGISFEVYDENEPSIDGVYACGEVIGAVVMLEENAEKPFDGADVKLALLGACFLARKFN